MTSGASDKFVRVLPSEKRDWQGRSERSVPERHASERGRRQAKLRSRQTGAKLEEVPLQVVPPTSSFAFCRARSEIGKDAASVACLKGTRASEDAARRSFAAGRRERSWRRCHYRWCLRQVRSRSAEREARLARTQRA